MIIKNKILYFSLGFIYSIILVGCLYLVLTDLSKGDILKELAIYYQSIGEKHFSEKFENGYYFFNNLFLFVALLLIPLFKLLKNTIIRNKIFYAQNSLLFIIFVLSAYIKDFAKINFTEILYLVWFILTLFSIIKSIVEEFNNKEIPNIDKNLNHYEELYYIILIGLYFFIITVFHNLSDLYVIPTILISFFLTLFVPYIFKKRIRIESLRFYKPLMLILLIIVTALLINTSILYHKYTSYYNQLPTSYILNENTAFYESLGVLNNSCQRSPISPSHVSCYFSNRNGFFDDYYFDSATININSEIVVQLLNSADYRLKTYFFIDNGMHSFIINDYTLIKSNDGYILTIDLNQYLDQYKIKNISSVDIAFMFVDTDNMSIKPSDFITNYEITLTKFRN